MRIGIGLPNPVKGADGRALVEWARRADAAGFSTLATIGRVAYPSYDDLTTLAAAAGATERIGLLTNILLGPARNPVWLAKQAASVDRLSGGRFTLGISAGGRQDDFAVAGMGWSNRGRRLTATSNRCTRSGAARSRRAPPSVSRRPRRMARPCPHHRRRQ
ncbi:hypothetical protein BH18CHL2_BH18CHL2_00930 [soil metagenome]